MRALTLIRPMSAAIVHGTKRIENRPRDLPAWMKGRPTVVAVHAGKTSQHDYEVAVHEIDGVWRDEFLPSGFHAARYKAASYADRMNDEGIVGLMRLTGRVFTHQDVEVYSSPMRDNNDHDYVREVLLDGEKTSVQLDWYSGPFGYEIDAAVAFAEPIACRGMLGFWTVPDDVCHEIVVGRMHEWLQTFRMREVAP